MEIEMRTTYMQSSHWMVQPCMEVSNGMIIACERRSHSASCVQI